MNERGWFTLLVRGIGLWLIGHGLLRGVDITANHFLYTMQFSTFGGGGAPDQWVGLLAGVIPVGVPLIVGLYLVFGAAWIINRLCRSVVGCCRVCGYRIAGLKDDVLCPECGSPIRSLPSQPNRARDDAPSN